MNDLFDSSEEFCKSIFSLFADNIEMTQPDLADLLREKQKNINDYRSLSYAIKRLIISLKKKVVLLIEELLYNYLLEESEIKSIVEKLTQESINQFIKANELDMEKIMLKFKEFMYEEV